MSDKTKGIYKKYNVERVDGKPIKEGCVVLELDDPNSLPALAAYADTMKAKGFNLFADDLYKVCSEHVGSSFDDYLKEEGIFEEVTANAQQKVINRLLFKLDELREDYNRLTTRCDRLRKALKRAVIRSNVFRNENAHLNSVVEQLEEENENMKSALHDADQAYEENARLRTQNANRAEAAGELAEILYGMIGHPIYRYKGWIFEAPERSEPWPLTAELSPKANAGAKFWDMYDEWKALPIAERESYRIKC